MAKRERLEDLGRITAMLDVLMKNDVFEWNEGHRNKDTAEWFETLDKDKQFDKIHSLAYSISYLNEQLSEIWAIARWGDDEDDL